jgi:4-amino-4-deoxy-L-arabinose transferase-like glycosyltransferase
MTDDSGGEARSSRGSDLLGGRPGPGGWLRRAPAAGLVALSLLVILPGLGRRDVVNSHEARVVQAARAMAEAGWPWAARPVEVPAVELADVGTIKRLRPRADGATLTVNPWLVPVMNGAVRLQKPPLPYWAAAASIKLFGYSEASARLPAAVLGALSAALVFDLGRRAFGRRVGWYAGLAWASLYFVYDEHRKAMADPYLAFATLAAVWAWGMRCRGVGVTGWRSEEGSVGVSECGGVGVRTEPRSQVLLPRHPHTPTLRNLLLFYLLLALGVLAKGPVVFLHVGAGVAACHLCVGGRPPGRWRDHALGLALLLAVAVPWPAYVLGHVPNAAELWRYESVGEFADNAEKARPLLFYLPELLLVALPWSAVWAAHTAGSAGRWWLLDGGPSDGAPSPLRRRRRRRELFPVVWLAVVVAVLSLSNVKKNAYLLPAMPAVALSVGCGLRHLTAARRLGRGGRPSPLIRRAAAWLVGGHVAFAAAFAGVLPALAAWAEASGETSAWSPDQPTLARAIGWGVLAAGVVGGTLAVAARRSGGRRWPAAQAVAFALLVAALFNAVGAPVDNRRSAKAACAEAARLLTEGGRSLATDKLSEEVGVYLPLDPRDAVRPDGRFAARVLLMWDDADGVEARRRRRPAKPFDPRGWQVDGGRVTAFAPLPVPGNPRDARWKLFELTVDRTLVAAR